jgi:nucleoside-diphosphate-sugar epimerase
MSEICTAANAAATDKHVFKRVFITGGSGFVGRNLILHFAGKGAEVVALVRSEKAAELVTRLGATAYRGDLLNSAMVDGMKGCDLLIHAAADTSHGTASPEQMRVNEEGTRLVLQSAQTAGIRKVVHLSTESVLATGNPLINVDETTPVPRSAVGEYSRSKAAAEAIALAHNAKDFQVVVLRPRFVWGRDDTTALPALIEAAKSGKFAWIGGGNYLTSTTHIANLCFAVECALENGRGGEVYLISDGEPVEFRAFVTALLETQNITAPEKTVPRAVVRAIAMVGDFLAKLSGGRIVPPLTMQAFATSAVEVSLNIGKARRELGYVPLMSRKEGLEELRYIKR